MPSAHAGPQQWILQPADPAAVPNLSQKLQCPEAIATLLVSRGLSDSDTAQTFLNPTLEDLHDPRLMLGMDLAVARIQRAVQSSEPILIYGDYDVDGTTATVLLKTAIERIAPKESPAKVTYHVPHRIREGYGMQTAVLGNAAAEGIRLVISVDTGIRAFAAAAEAKSLGLDLIVTDHHLPDQAIGIPEAIAVLNPAQADCQYPFKSLCGAAVAFKLAHGLLLAAAETAEDRESQLLRLKKGLIPSFLKLVAIATIADSVPLEGENRVIASLGLRELRNPIQPGLRALMQVAQIPIDRPPTATEVGFRIAPRINAAGRMDVASEVVELFLTKDPTRATELAGKLNRLNDERRATEMKALEAIEIQLETRVGSSPDLLPECIILDDPAWHRGVLGILASRVVDRTGCPALILTHEDGHAHGSGRSIEGFHLLDALTAIHGPVDAPNTLFTRFGGHAHAVGFSLPSERLELLRDRMHLYGSTRLTETLVTRPLQCDAEIPFSDLNQDLLHWLAQCEPFGTGNREPLFVTRGLTLAAPVRIIKEKHVCLKLEKAGYSHHISALGWSRTTSWPARCERMALGKGSNLDIAYRVKSKSNPQFPGPELELIDVRSV